MRRTKTARAQSPQRVLREVERVQAGNKSSGDPGKLTDQSGSHINAVANLLRDHAVVLIGGDRRPRVKRRIEKAFDLQELHWHDTRPHQSHMPIEPYIARPRVKVVLLAIRWASHNLGEVQNFCARYDKPLVRLPSGYNTSQIAHQILQQASHRLYNNQSRRYIDMAAGR